MIGESSCSSMVEREGFGALDVVALAVDGRGQEFVVSFKVNGVGTFFLV